MPIIDRMVRAVRRHGLHGVIVLALQRSRDFFAGEHRLRTPARLFLERIVIRHYMERPEVAKVLFVGCERYTAHYSKWFRQKEYWTIEPDPLKRRYGAKHHVVDVLQNLDAHFEPKTFDLIICNGVFGFGLNDRADCEKAFEHCFTRLVGGGEFMLSWCDVPQYCPFPPESLRSLSGFEPMEFGPIGTSGYECEGAVGRNIFKFYRKPV